MVDPPTTNSDRLDQPSETEGKKIEFFFFVRFLKIFIHFCFVFLVVSKCSHGIFFLFDSFFVFTLECFFVLFLIESEENFRIFFQMEIFFLSFSIRWTLSNILHCLDYCSGFPTV